jgi:hypothetical protein
VQRDRGDDQRFKSVRRSCDFVFANRQIRNRVIAIFSARSSVALPGLNFDCDHVGMGNNCPLGIQDHTGKSRVG